MKRTSLGVIFATAVCLATASAFAVDMKNFCLQGEPRGLTVERLESPCGVDVQSPRFGWKMAAEKGKKGVVQSAYRILVASSKEKLGADAGDVWDSGKVSGADTIDVAYGGKPLLLSRRYWWKVRTWDGAGAESAWSAPATWVTGIMPPDGWKAKWIGPAPETRPDADLSGAQWITAPKGKKGKVTLQYKFTFAGAKPGEYVEMVHAAVPQHVVRVNGKSCHLHSGHIHNWRYLRFRDITPWLVVGENSIEVEIVPDNFNPSVKEPYAFLARFNLPGGKSFGTDATWTSPDGAVKSLGAAKEPEFAKGLVTRCETASPAFEKTFTVSKPVASAVLHVTGPSTARRSARRCLTPRPRCSTTTSFTPPTALTATSSQARTLCGYSWATAGTTCAPSPRGTSMWRRGATSRARSPSSRSRTPTARARRWRPTVRGAR